MILFVQNASATTSLTGPQLEMLDVADAEDPDVKVHDKLFVFLNRIDQTTGDLDKRLEKSRVEWASKAKCPAARIVPGSAAAYLVKNNSFIRPETEAAIRFAREGLERLDTPHGDGVEYLQQVIERYLDHERTEVIRRRVASMVTQGRLLARELLDALRGRFPESTEELDLRLRLVEIEAPARWFDAKWEEFQRRFGTFWSEKVAPVSSQDDMDGVNPKLERLRGAYLEAIREVSKSFPTAAAIVEEHARLRPEFPTPVAVNIAVRNSMLERYVDPGLETVTLAMTQTVVEVAREIADWVVREGFHGVEGVRGVVFPERSIDAYAKTIEVGLRTLFLRHARPARSMFLRTPRHTEDRRLMLKRFRSEVRVLEEFYKNPKAPVRRFLAGYLEDGQWIDREALEKAAAAVLTAAGAATSPTVAAVAGTAAKTIAERIKQGSGGAAATGKPVTSVGEEIAADCEAFLDYLEHSIYRAAAFEDFAMQELDRLRTPLLATSARSARDAIREQVFAAYIRKHPPLIAALGETVGDDARIRQVVQAVSMLRTALVDLDSAHAPAAS